MKYILLFGRLLFSSLFIIASLGHFNAETIAFASSKGVPLANVLVPLSGILLLIGGITILIGYKARLGAWALVLFLVPVTMVMHNFWNESDPAAQMIDRVMFLKNLSLLGASLIIAYFGSGPLSVDKS